MSEEFLFSEAIQRDHPACDGHFVGNPVLPGVIILEHVRLALKKFNALATVKSFKKVKFTHILKPGEILTVHLKKTNDHSFQFLCQDSLSHLVASGEMTVNS